MGLEFTDDIEEVHRLWQAGEREAAGERVPIEIGLHTNLIGDDAAVTERLRRYRDAGIDTLRVGIDGADATQRLDDLARLMDLVATVDTTHRGGRGVSARESVQSTTMSAHEREHRH